MNPLHAFLPEAPSPLLADHLPQSSWRSEAWDFVSFTGSAGVWRAEAIERAGGWQATSLVEGCELSFRVLFSGYRTAFVRIPVPAELPTACSAYRDQAWLWTAGWAQLTRAHLGTLLLRYECGRLRRLHLVCHMCLSVQWPLWLVLLLAAPWLEDRTLFYFAPIALHGMIASAIVSYELCGQYDALGHPPILRGALLFLRIIPSSILAVAMVPHQACAWCEGLLRPAVPEATPESGSVGKSASANDLAASAKDAPLAVRGWGPTPYTIAEGSFVLYFAACARYRPQCWWCAFLALAVGGLRLLCWGEGSHGQAIRRSIARCIQRCGPQTQQQRIPYSQWAYRRKVTAGAVGVPLSAYSQPLLQETGSVIDRHAEVDAVVSVVSER